MGEYAPGLIALFVLLAFNAFFVGAEFAVISARRSQIEPRAEAGSKAAQTSLYAMEHATLMLATSQLGITICSLLILNVSEPAIHHLLEVPLGLTPLTADVIACRLRGRPGAGDVPARGVRRDGAEEPLLLGAGPGRPDAGSALVFVSRVFRPIIWALNGMANAVLRLFKVEPKDEATSTYTLDEVAAIVEQSTREGVSPTPPERSPTRSSSPPRRCTTSRCRWPRSSPCRALTPDQVQLALAEHGFSRYILPMPTAIRPATSTSRT